MSSSVAQRGDAPATWNDTFVSAGRTAARQAIGVAVGGITAYGVRRALDSLAPAVRPAPSAMTLAARNGRISSAHELPPAPQRSTPVILGPQLARAGVINDCGLPGDMLGGILRPSLSQNAGGHNPLAQDLFGLPGVGPLHPGTLEQLDPTLGAPIQHVDQALITRIGERAGESAVSHALTATGAVAGGYAGQALIPVPGVGAVIGGIVGGWLGSCLGDAWNEVRR